MKAFSCFIHTCEPQAEAPKPLILPNDKLSQKVAEMVQKGLNASPKVVMNQTLEPTKNTKIDQKTAALVDQFLQPNNHNISMINMEPLSLNHVIPLHNNEVKLELQPQLQQITQVVLNAPSQLDLSEPLLMCQPTLMFDPSQIIPVTAHHLTPHHFVQVHSHNIPNHNHYL